MKGSQFKVGDWICRPSVHARIQVKYVGAENLIGAVFMWDGKTHEGCWDIHASGNQDWAYLQDHWHEPCSSLRTHCEQCGALIRR